MTAPATPVDDSRAGGGATGGRSVFYSARNLAVLVMLAAVAGLAYVIHRGSDRPSLEHETGRVLMIDEQGRTFDARLPAVGSALVTVSPWKTRAFPAELCYWKPDGGVKSDPTPVLLRQYIEDLTASTHATYCPDCGRLVVPGNPVPYRDEITGQILSKPPPLRPNLTRQVSSPTTAASTMPARSTVPVPSTMPGNGPASGQAGGT